MDPDKRKRNSRKSVTAAEAFTSILHAARDLRIRGGLPPGKQNMAREAAFVLNTPQSTRVRQGYRIFLCDIYEKCGPHGVLLCAIQLGQHRSMTMRKSSREDLVNVMELNKDNTNIKCSEIELCATEYGIYQVQENFDLEILPEQGYREYPDLSSESWDDLGECGLCSIDITSSSFLEGDTMPGVYSTNASRIPTGATDHTLASFPPLQDPRPEMMASDPLHIEQSDLSIFQGVIRDQFLKGGA